MDWIIFGSLFAGCFMRTIIPFLKKRKKAVESGEPLKWDNTFLITMIFGLAVSLVVAFISYPSMGEATIPIAFGFGWASQDIINKVVG